MDAHGPAHSAPDAMQVWGYIPDYDHVAAYASARANRALLTGVTQVRFHLDGAGDLVEYPGSSPLPDWVRAEQLPVAVLIANQVSGAWDQDVVAQVLRDPARRDRHIRRVVACALADGYSAVEMDYELLRPSLRDHFSTFVGELARALHAEGKQLAVAVHAKLSEPGDPNGPAAQDWAMIGEAADRITVMTYDFDPTTPGPIAPIAWTREVLAFALTHIPAAKVLQGVPLYGYVWTADEAPSYVTFPELMDRARRHGRAPRRDPTDHYLVLEAEDEGRRLQAWVPDGETVARLASVGRELGVAGYALWRLGAEEPSALASLTAPRTTRGC